MNICKIKSPDGENLMRSYLVLSDKDSIEEFNRCAQKWTEDESGPESVTKNFISDIHEPFSDIESTIFVQPTDCPAYFKDRICLGELIRCKTTYVERFDMFYLQPVEELLSLRRWERTLAERYVDLKRDSDKADSLEFIEGRYFAAFLQRIPSELEKWYRVQVVSYSYSSRLLVVFLIDYGNIVVVHEKNVRRLTRRLLLEFKALAIPCKFWSYGNINKETEDQIATALKPMGKMYSQYLEEQEALELVKFHEWYTDPQTNLTTWRITSTLVHPYKPELLTPDIDLAQFIIKKYFKEGIRPEKDPKYIDINRDWAMRFGGNEKKIPEPFIEKWIKTENNLWTETETEGPHNHKTTFSTGLTVEQDIRLNFLFESMNQPHFHGSKSPYGDVIKDDDDEFLNIKN